MQAAFPPNTTNHSFLSTAALERTNLVAYNPIFVEITFSLFIDKGTRAFAIKVAVN
jgi:hypothetical protein